MNVDESMTSSRECRICANDASHARFSAREMMFGTREVFQYFQCIACGCLQIDKIPEDIGKYYPVGYGGHSLRRKKSQGKILSYLQKQRYRNAIFDRGYKVNRLLSPFVPITHHKVDNALPVIDILKIAGVSRFDARFLDVGCGNWSKWLEYLSAMGFSRLNGIDPLIAESVSDHGIEIRKQSITDTQGQFDVITYHHSLEHISDQQEQFLNAKRLLAPGGVLIIRIPIVSGWTWQRYGVNWVEMDPPRHLYLHSRKSVAWLARTAGFELFKTVCDSTEFEFFGSEQYKLDIPLDSPTSYWKNPESSGFSEGDISKFRKLAEAANREQQGGRAAFFFRAC